ASRQGLVAMSARARLGVGRRVPATRARSTRAVRLSDSAMAGQDRMKVDDASSPDAWETL
ncbi:hypothetical protein GW17_00027814, partial [Ensete ventricosum]